MPEWIDPSTLNLSEIDLTDSESELSIAILENVRVSDKYQEIYQNQGIDMEGIYQVAVFLLGILLEIYYQEIIISILLKRNKTHSGRFWKK